MNYNGCPYCDNAIINKDLTSNTDLSYLPIGNYLSPGYEIYFRTGNRQKTAIEFSTWSDKYQKSIIIGEYTPKFCPECGRELIENK